MYLKKISNTLEGNTDNNFLETTLSSFYCTKLLDFNENGNKASFQTIALFQALFHPLGQASFQLLEYHEQIIHLFNIQVSVCVTWKPVNVNKETIIGQPNCGNFSTMTPPQKFNL